MAKFRILKEVEYITPQPGKPVAVVRGYEFVSQHKHLKSANNKFLTMDATPTTIPVYNRKGELIRLIKSTGKVRMICDGCKKIKYRNHS